MRRLRVWFLRLAGLFNKERRERELAEEIESHLRLHIQDNLQSGMTPEEARRDAVIRLGGIEPTKEICRDRRGVPVLEALMQDLGFGVRMLRRNPGFAAIAVVTLALGIGANTAVFSIVNGVLLRPLPFRGPAQLVVIGEWNPHVASQAVGASYLNFDDWRRQNHVFDNMAACRDLRMTLVGRGEPQRVTGMGVSSAFFPLLGVEAYLGRTLAPEDENAGRQTAVVISYGFYQKLFSGARSVLGQTLVLNNIPRTIVGVLPRGFRFLQDVDCYTPLDVPAQARQIRGIRFLRVIARLKPGVSLLRAQSDMDGIAQHLAQDYAKYDEGWGVSLVSLEDKVVGHVRHGLLVLLGTVGFVLLIACANVANLLLSRGAARGKEIALRVALGAGRARVVVMLLLESLLLATVSAVAALALAFTSLELLRSLAPTNLPRLDEVSLDGRVLGFTLLVTLVTGLLFGSAPARQAARVNLLETLKEGERRSSCGRSRLRGFLTVSEVAITLVLLIAAGLLGRSFLRLLSVNPGYRTEKVLSLELSLPQYKYPQDFQQAEFFRTLLDRAQALPGVRSIALTSAVPLSGNESRNSFAIEGRKTDEAEWAALWSVTPDYFRTLGIPILQGRSFGEQDTKGAPEVAIINEGLARKYWPNRDAIGKRILFGDTGPTVVGVVGNVKQTGLADKDEPEMYLPYWQDPGPVMTLVAETEGDPLDLVAPLRALVRAVDKDQPIEHIQTMEDLLARSVAEPRQLTLLVGVFSLLSLVLVAVGIYGVISYSVSQRTHEIGIRMALGARRQDVFLLIIGQGTRHTFLGIAIGVAASFGLTRIMAGLLYGIEAGDPVTFAGVAALVVAVALAACYFPAWRAMRVDPVVALRYE